VKEYLQELEFEKIVLDFPKEFDEMRDLFKQLFENYVGELRSRKLLFGRSNKTELIRLQRKISGYLMKGSRNFNYLLGASTCAQAIKIHHAMELLETQTLSGFNKYLQSLENQALKKQSKGVVKLVSKPEFTLVFHKTKQLIEKGIKHPKIGRLIEIIKEEKLKNKKIKILIFTQFRETAQTISKKLNQEKIKSKIFVGQAKKESGGLSQKEQKEIIEEFSRGDIEILCATCIGEEGLDIPEVNSVIFYETVPSAIRTIQRTGRTARLMKGKLIILLTKNTRDEINYYVSKSREKKMYEAIDSIKEDLIKGYGFGKEQEQKTIGGYY
jgi:Fanconi anemia group M protein